MQPAQVAVFPGLIPTSTVSVRPSPTPPPTCSQLNGRIETASLPSLRLGSSWAFRIYLPPCFDPLRKPGYPVLYLIHGLSSSDDQWDRLGVDETADKLIASLQLPPFLIVMPYDASTAQPSADPFDEALVEELLPWIESHYAGRPERNFRAVGGLSRGAAWALHLGLVHPDLFGAIGAHSLPVFWEDAALVPRWIAAIAKDQIPRIYLDIGRGDPEVGPVSSFEADLTQANIAHEWHLNLGYHEEAYWSAHLEQYLRWYAQPWGESSP